ncbi:MAG: tetratricopeptide repeat protein [Candidatus Halichondribacter symbioticus]
MDDADKAHQMVKAALGDAQASFVVGMMYHGGTDGVFQNYEEAGKFLLVAANGGILNAQLHLGVMYQEGRGFPQNYIHAHMWYNIAASTGDTTGVENRDIIAKIMTPEQIAKAQDMAVEVVKPRPRAGIF